MEKKLRRRNKVWGIFLFGVYVTTWRLVREPYVKEREREEKEEGPPKIRLSKIKIQFGIF